MPPTQEKESARYTYHFDEQTPFLSLEEAKMRLEDPLLSDKERQNYLKMCVGYEIASLVQDGQTLGIGSGSTSEAAIRAIGERLKKEPHLNVYGVATSRKLAVLAQSMGILVEDFDTTLKNLHNPPEKPDLDWGFDGADEVKPIVNEEDQTIIEFISTKGGGGAELIEESVAKRCKKWRMIVDSEKIRDEYGAYPVAVEVKPDALDDVKEIFETRYSANEVTVKPNDKGTGPFITDSGNMILRVGMGVDRVLPEYEDEWETIDGVVPNGVGIFYHVQPSEVILAYGPGKIAYLRRGDIYNPKVWKTPTES